MSAPQRGLHQDVTLAPALSTPAMTYKGHILTSYYSSVLGLKSWCHFPLESGQTGCEDEENYGSQIHRFSEARFHFSPGKS